MSIVDGWSYLTGIGVVAVPHPSFFAAARRGPNRASTMSHAPEVELELFTHRFSAIAAEMGEMLQRTALSTNVRDRLDFSCALLDGHGQLVVNAPHIPVHLGALGLCVRSVTRTLEQRG